MKEFSAETRAKMSASARTRKPETRVSQRLALTGRSQGAAQRAKQSAAMMGHAVSESTKDKIRRGKLGSLNPGWKGDDAKYSAVHTWLWRNATKTGVCSTCGKSPRVTHWANVTGRYSHDVNDYLELCPSCHKFMDMKG